MKYLLTLQSELQTSLPDTLKSGITEKLQELSQMTGHDIVSALLNIVAKWGLKVLAAFAIYLIGRWIIKYLKKLLTNIMTKRKVEKSLFTFTISFVNITLTVLLFVIVVSILGVPTSTFAALIAAGGLAIGMALSGTLQNFAGGIMLLLFRPFKVGDFIEACEFSGTVDAINITTTQIHTVDNKIIYIPNGNLSNNNIQNYTVAKTRRADWKVNIAYGDDAHKGIELLKSYLNADPRVLQQPEAPFAAIDSFGDSSVVLVARAWCKAEDYWSLHFDINKLIYEKLPGENIHFPFPQLDVFIKNQQEVKKQEKQKQSFQKEE